MSNRFGWRSGTLKCQNAKIQGDLYVQDDIVFSDVSAGALGVTGGIDMQSTTSAIGIDMGGTFSTAAINIDGTCSTAGIVMAGGSSYNPIHIGVKANTVGSGLDMSGADSYDDQNGVMIFCDDGGALAATYTTSAIWTRYLITESQSSNTATGAYLQLKSLAATFTSCDYSATKVYLELAGAITLASGNLSVINAGLELGGAFTDTAEALSGIDVNINDGTNALSTAKNSAGVRIRKTSGSTAGFPIGLYIEDSGATTGIQIGTGCTTAISATVASTGSSRVAPIDVIWTSDATYGTGDRIRGTGGMSACLNIGNATTAAAITGDGDHLAIYTNMDISVAITGDTTVMGGGYHVVSLKTVPTQHMGIIAPVTGYARNEVVCDGSTEFIASRGVIYTASDAESVSQTAGEFSIIDATGTRATVPDIKGVLINLNVADNNVGGGNVVGLQLEENGALAATEGILFKIGTFTKGIDFQDQCTTAIDIGDCTTGISFTGTTSRALSFATAAGAANSGDKGSTAGGYITVYVDGATRYINCVTGV